VHVYVYMCVYASLANWLDYLYIICLYTCICMYVHNICKIGCKPVNKIK
jgi:hypothetical protein